MIYLIQGTNILVLLGMLIVPFILGYFFIKKIREKNEESETLEVRMALLENRVKELEEYIEDSRWE
ncbi:hypothetical protein SAMN02745120_1800 [Acetoanaerobium noterae]|jgi:hypothetical protein|uniref:Uncharacterized protein n=1 Tax=Acetoanaerobium noterae TaxID=745369 RepID=A0A1T5BQH3_9FIRM|nr:hypothetical protein [Acetoanaerobium noterae]MBP8762766.1 hypothetical protein [Acetoanaerobium sp.]MDK2803748.1 hypothetical protein [Peptostreptococcaceae bacterium]MBP9499876.1 hypothetical protein [Acetoanaerobium sp.]MBP9562010.1 hypothetical protein [Acetoanaerobium sp.]SKB49488.1 hypothetical protein SAMN02745120_1800 [Acetoanaerobium noterae]